MRLGLRLLLLEQMSQTQGGIVQPDLLLLLLLLEALQAAREVRVLRQQGGILLRRPEEQGGPVGIAQGDGLPAARDGRRNCRRTTGTGGGAGDTLLLLLLLLKRRDQPVLLDLVRTGMVGQGGVLLLLQGRMRLVRLVRRRRLLLLAAVHTACLGLGLRRPEAGGLEDLRVRVRPARRAADQAGGVGVAGIRRLLLLLLLLLLGQVQLLLLLVRRPSRPPGGAVLTKEGVVWIGP